VTLEDTIQEIAEALGVRNWKCPEADPLTETLGEDEAKAMQRC
jgi:hypothetical protein